MKNKTLVAIGVAIIVIFGFLFVAYKLTNTPTPLIYKEVNVIRNNDHLAWSPTKKNILVEYSDFQCPACRNFHLLLKQIEAENVTFVYRHFPLSQHDNADDAAYAAEAAGKQGKFYEMSDLLFKNQDEWAKLPNPKEYFAKLAEQLKLDTNQFSADMNSQSVKDKVNTDLASGAAADVNATPTFYLNGRKLDFIRSFDEFKSLLLTQD